MLPHRQIESTLQATVNLFEKCLGLDDVGNSAHSEQPLST